MLDRIERQEVWERGYDQLPEFVWQDQKRRGLMLARNFHQDFVAMRARPNLEEARSWYAEHAVEFGEPERRHFRLLHVRDWDQALAAREILAATESPSAALAQIRRQDPTAGWVGSGQAVVRENQISGPLDKQLFRIDRGQVTEPVPHEGRFAIARLESIEPRRVPVFEEVAEAVVEQIARARADSTFKAYLVERKSITTIEINEEVFRQMRFDATSEES